MHSINVGMVSGRLGKDLTDCLKYTTSGRASLVFGLAVDDGYWSKEKNEWVDRTHWLTIKAWGKDAEYFAPKFSKGDHVVVYVKIKSSQQEINGKKYSFNELEVNSDYGGIKALGAKSQNSGPTVRFSEVEEDSGSPMPESEPPWDN